MSLSVPEPDAAARDLSARLTARLRAEIDAGGGWIGFDRFMQRALYEPGLGYYSAGSVKLGPEGDFVTAPELSPLLGQILAARMADWLESLVRPVVLELGAGSGALAQSILEAWRETGEAAPAYRIIETSADLKQRQRQRLAAMAAQVEWLDAPPAAPFEGIVLANEVLDALPVARFVKRASRVRPLGVGWRQGRFVWLEGPRDEALSSAVEALERDLGLTLPDGFRSELCLMLPSWLKSVTESLVRGAVLLIDYGLVRREYYHPSRYRGTLTCHYRHRAHADPFLWPGLQDISAWVDFSACADAAQAAGLEVAGFTTQGQFLLHCDAQHRLERLGERDYREYSRALKTLVLPGEMGERFKLLLLCRGLDLEPLPGRDFRDRL
jgi:SAM-dependent MidA family methyltransferase